MSTLQTGTVLKHGSFSLQSRFNIIQHKYAGSEGGYVELLEILNPPFGYSHFYICNISHDFPSSFTECQSSESAMIAWHIYFSNNYLRLERALNEVCSFKFRLVMLKDLEPWFYADTDETIEGDFVQETPQAQLSF